MNASRRLSYLLLAVITLCLAISPAQAQRGQRGGSQPNLPPQRRDTTTQLEIQVTGPDSRQLAIQVAVDLISNAQPMGNRTFTNTDGRATFTVSGSGTYQVKVTGPEIIDSVSDSFWIQPGESSHREYVAVKLKSASTTGTTPLNTDSTISASQLNVPEKARKEYYKGMDAVQKQDWKKAEEHLMKATHEYPNYDWAYNGLGVAYMNMGDKDQARTAFKRAVEINDHNVQAERNLARIFIGDGDFKRAEELAKRSLLTHPQDADGLTLEGYAQLQQGKFDEALDSARRVHTAEKHAYPFSHLIAAHALEAKHLNKEAAAEYRTYLSESPDAPASQAKLAEEGLQRTGR